MADGSLILPAPPHQTPWVPWLPLHLRLLAPVQALELKYGRGGNLLVNRDDNDFVREFICPPLREALQLFENWSQFLWRVNELNHGVFL